MRESLDEVVARTSNFGYLMAYEPLLAYDGAAAQAHIYSDVDTVTFHARRFAEVVTRKAAALLGLEDVPRSLPDRVAELDRLGVLAPWMQQAIYEIRTAAYAAMHGHLHDPVKVVIAVHGCFDLGLWLHNTITCQQQARPFVPPRLPDGTVAQPELQALLAAHERRLIAIGLTRRASAGRSAATRAGATADAISRTTAERDNGTLLRARMGELESHAASSLLGLADRLAQDVARYETVHDAFRASAERADAVVESEMKLLAIAASTPAGLIPRPSAPMSANSGCGHYPTIVAGAGRVRPQ
ncbi:type I restriction enzyme R subunit [Allocatelliglobosispora scoriae]|uniref:Type I restriction enzyme R subunit n=1 Tax=Allocatelliglobosispora scoriae TaxID=643052 RepID=A0A841BN64_9ACTN|nr:hypothetical protein [Allocatelliglobosispora scoriae]MBB5868726.1 type I restriction enzyme R subunit [Allocatelliglobosispora scoriae]